MGENQYKLTTYEGSLAALNHQVIAFFFEEGAFYAILFSYKAFFYSFNLFSSCFKIHTAPEEGIMSVIKYKKKT